MNVRCLVLFLLLLVLGCQLEPANSDQLSVTITGESLYANGVATATVSITLTGNVTPGKALTVTTSLGVLDPAAAPAQQRTVTVHTTSTKLLELPLYAERTAGDGRVTVTGPDGIRDFADFTIEPVADTLTLSGDTELAADGKASVDLMLTLTSSDPGPREVTLKTSAGTLAPEKSGEAARQRTIRVEPDKASTFRLYAPSSPGTAVVTAELGTQLATSIVTFTAAHSRAVTFVVDGATEEMPAEALADGQGVVLVTLRYDGPPDEVASITLSTTLGELNPTAATPEGRRQTTLSIRSGSDGGAHLRVGRTPGDAILTAAGQAIPTVSTLLALRASLPDRLALGLVDGSVLDTTRSQVGVTAALRRSAGSGSISTGVPIEFLACCDAAGSSAPCTEFVSVPSFQVDADGDGRETVTVTLTPSGRARVSEVGTSSRDDTPVVLHSFVSEDDAAPTCAELSNGDGAVLAHDSVRLALRKAAPAPPSP
jgi:hypothetical protein